LGGPDLARPPRPPVRGPSLVGLGGVPPGPLARPSGSGRLGSKGGAGHRTPVRIGLHQYSCASGPRFRRHTVNDYLFMGSPSGVRGLGHPPVALGFRAPAKHGLRACVRYDHRLRGLPVRHQQPLGPGRFGQATLRGRTLRPPGCGCRCVGSWVALRFCWLPGLREARPPGRIRRDHRL
jgi:hypothetical protein